MKPLETEYIVFVPPNDTSYRWLSRKDIPTLGQPSVGPRGPAEELTIDEVQFSATNLTVKHRDGRVAELYCWTGRLIPKYVEAALAYVQVFHPQVSMVVFNKEGRWLYMNDCFDSPAFAMGIDSSVLQDAIDQVDDNGDLPAVYQL